MDMEPWAIDSAKQSIPKSSLRQHEDSQKRRECTHTEIRPSSIVLPIFPNSDRSLQRIYPILQPCPALVQRHRLHHSYRLHRSERRLVSSLEYRFENRRRFEGCRKWSGGDGAGVERYVAEMMIELLRCCVRRRGEESCCVDQFLGVSYSQQSNLRESWRNERTNATHRQTILDGNSELIVLSAVF